MTFEDIIANIKTKTPEELARRAEQRRLSYQNTKGNSYPREKKYRDNLRIEMVEAYGGVCIECEESDPIVLVLDHINNDAQADRILNGHTGGYRLYAHLRRLGWPKKDHQLLCHNCNFRKEYHRRNKNAIEDSETG